VGVAGLTGRAAAARVVRGEAPEQAARTVDLLHPAWPEHDRIAPVQQRVLFIVLQECVTNSVRRGLATTVDINREERSADMRNSYRLRITDDGVGPVSRRLPSGVALRFLGELSDGSVELGFAFPKFHRAEMTD